MTDTDRAAPPPVPPAPPAPPAAAPPAPADAPHGLTFDSLPKREIDPHPAPEAAAAPTEAGAQEGDDRQVWRPPLPQYPARPERQATVQYEAPRMQPPPQYAPQQQYTAPQPPPPPAPPAYTPHSQAPQPAYAMSAPPMHAPQYAAPQQAIATMPAPKVSSARVGRRLARRMVMGSSGVGKALFGVRPGLMVLFLAILLFAGWLTYDKWMKPVLPSATPNAPNSSGMIALPPEVATVQTYFASIGKSDTDGVWNTLSPAEKANRITNGEDKTVLAAVLDFEKQNQLAMKYRYVGGMGKNGSTDLSRGGYYFYVQDLTFGSQNRSFPMYFEVDDQGKITNVNDQVYKLILQQLKGNGA